MKPEIAKVDRRANRQIVFHNQGPGHTQPAPPSNPASTNIFFKIGPLGLGGNSCDEHSVLPH